MSKRPVDTALVPIVDRTNIYCSEEAFAAFQHALDEPPKPSEALRKTMRAKPPWDDESPDGSGPREA